MTTTLSRRLAAIILSLSGFAFAQDPATGILKVEIMGLHESEGKVYLALYDSKSNWLSDDAVAVRELVIADNLDGEVVETELELPVGQYAFSVFYDADGDGELDTNFIGMPKEPIALSNNAKAKFGPPKFKDAVFDLQLEPVIQRVLIGKL